MLHPTHSQVPAKRGHPTDEGLGSSLHWMNPETSAQPRATKKSKARREGPLDAITKANAYLVKKIGACWLCRSQRGGKCSQDPKLPCKACQNRDVKGVWRYVPCRREPLKAFADHFVRVMTEESIAPSAPSIVVEEHTVVTANDSKSLPRITVQPPLKIAPTLRTQHYEVYISKALESMGSDTKPLQLVLETIKGFPLRHGHRSDHQTLDEDLERWIVKALALKTSVETLLDKIHASLFNHRKAQKTALWKWSEILPSLVSLGVLASQVALAKGERHQPELVEPGQSPTRIWRPKYKSEQANELISGLRDTTAVVMAKSGKLQSCNKELARAALLKSVIFDVSIDYCPPSLPSSWQASVTTEGIISADMPDQQPPAKLVDLLRLLNTYCLVRRKDSSSHNRNIILETIMAHLDAPDRVGALKGPSESAGNRTVVRLEVPSVSLVVEVTGPVETRSMLYPHWRATEQHSDNEEGKAPSDKMSTGTFGDFVDLSPGSHPSSPTRTQTAGGRSWKSLSPVPTDWALNFDTYLPEHAVERSASRSSSCHDIENEDIWHFMKDYKASRLSPHHRRDASDGAVSAGLSRHSRAVSVPTQGCEASIKISLHHDTSSLHGGSSTHARSPSFGLQPETAASPQPLLLPPSASLLVEDPVSLLAAEDRSDAIGLAASRRRASRDAVAASGSQHLRPPSGEGNFETSFTVPSRNRSVEGRSVLVK